MGRLNPSLPTLGFLASLTPSLRRANLQACAKLIATDIDYWSAECIVWAHRTTEDFGDLAACEFYDARSKKRTALRRRRRLWDIADHFHEQIGQPKLKSTMSPALKQLILSARDRYSADRKAA